MLLLRENLTFDNAHIRLEHQDDDSGRKNLFMSGIFIQGGIKNHNQRVYPVNEIRRAVESLNQQIIDTGAICGELTHPEELDINLDRVSHGIVEMRMDGPNGVGKLRIYPTPCGNIARTLLESGVKLGVSSRGSGNVDNGNVSDFEIVTVDIVARPSAPQAYPIPVYETRNGKRGKIIEDLAESVRHDPKAQKHLQKELLSWIDRLR
jgi:hypothetical protein